MEGRVLVEQRTYDISPGIPMSDFLKNYETLGLPAQKRILEGFLGYFTTEFGTQNQVRHFWAFTDLEDRRRRRAALADDPEWQECIAVVRPMIIRWDNLIMYPTAFSPIRELPVAPIEPNTAFTYGAP
jgi:NIPSNAP